MSVRGTLVGGVVVVGALLASPAAGAALPPTLGPGGCYDPTQANADFEAYGPTDVNVQAGNGRVTVNENADGTITVFKFPDPSLYNLIKYFAVSRDRQGHVHAQYPNEGSFAGIRYRTADGGRGFAWLRSWPSRQRYDSPDTPVPVTTYHSPAALGLRVTDIDVVPPDGSRLVREYWVRRLPGSPVRSASLVYFENFNPVASHIPFLPIADWCNSETSDGQAAYVKAGGAILNWWTGPDVATGQLRSMAVAVGLDGAASAHQVGGDGFDAAALPLAPPDAYSQAPRGLGGSDRASGQTTGALEEPLRFDRQGRAAATVTIAAGRTRDAALAALAAGRGGTFAAQMAAESRDWRAFLGGTRLPAGGGGRVTDVAKRSLISVRLARSPRTGAIVASANTQGPYGEDWIRDGAFINRLLDVNGLTGWVTRHNLFYARVQASPSNPSPVRPPGNWSMAYYSDGVDGAPIPWEIDETGLGAWTLYDHYRYLRGDPASSYLRRVYPAIARAADFLTRCRDPLNGLQCLANEDDNYTPSQSLHGAGPVYLGLESAIRAASALGERGARVEAWRHRLAELRAAIGDLYDPASHTFSAGNSAGNAYNVDYGDGGWMLWPVHFRDCRTASMRGEARAVDAAMKRSLAAPQGQYEAKALLGLAHAWRPYSPAHRHELDSTLRYLARNLTTPTGLFGESWERLPNGHPLPVQDQPHVWEHTLFYLAALEIEGSRAYSFSGPGVYLRDCARGTAPAGAC